MGRPPKFTREQVQAAALDLVDRHGLESLSMRALAAELGTGAMTIYNYAAHREDLEVLVVEAVMAQAWWRPEPGEDWRAQVHGIAAAGWHAVRAHPHALPLILTRRSRSPAVIDISEALLAALARGGLSGQHLLVGLRAVSAFVMGFSQAELAGPLSLQAGESAQATIGRFRALPADRYPHLVEMASAALSSDAQAEFRAGLDALLTGLAASRPALRRRAR
jgi:AcrR family transcriptional regulator